MTKTSDPVLFALVSAQGTACSETGLCSRCTNSDRRALLEASYCNRLSGGPDSPLSNSWTECTDNEAICCAVCGFEGILSDRSFKIRGPVDDGEQLYWSNADGWVDWASADTFDGQEWCGLNLPIGGSWHRIK